MLTETAIRAIKPAEKPRKLSDGGGLHLLITSQGTRLWRIHYRYGGKQQTLSLGRYPDVPLKLARERRDEVRKLLANGIDPSAKRKSERATPADSFEAVARELLAILRKSSLSGELPPGAAGEVVERTIQPHRKRKARRREPISADTIDTMQRRLEAHVFPHIGTRDVKVLTSQELLTVLRRIEERGTFELAHRVRSICSRVLRYGKATGRRCEDVATDLIGLLVPYESEHMAAIIEPRKTGALLRAIDHYHGNDVTCLALKLAPLIFPRPINFRTMEWSQLQLEGPEPEWRVPWKRMKMRDPHIVPLSRQAVSIIRQLHALTGDGRYVFPNPRSAERPMSENCITVALRAMGFSGEEMSWHGFRAMASTLLNELGWNDKWIETQLAHSERNKSKKAYNHAKYLPQRRQMMQAWADYLDELRASEEQAALSQAGQRAGSAALTAARWPQPHEGSIEAHAVVRRVDGAVSAPVTTRADHLRSCKQRALEFVARGDVTGAFECLATDFQRHPETSSHDALEFGMKLMMSGFLRDPDRMRAFITSLS